MKRTAKAARLPLDEEILRPTFRRERAALKRGVWPVAGCDEAGRGPLAGPVVAAARSCSTRTMCHAGSTTQKGSRRSGAKCCMSASARAQVAVALAPPWRIDRDNILRASLWALARAVASLPVKPQLVFVDGRDRIDAGCDCQAVIGGDGLVASVAAASIVAKGDARSPDDAAWRRASGLRIRTPYGLQRARAFRRIGPARPDRPSPPLILAGRRCARPSRQRARRSRRCGFAAIISRTYAQRSKRLLHGVIPGAAAGQSPKSVAAVLRFAFGTS